MRLFYALLLVVLCGQTSARADEKPEMATQQQAQSAARNPEPEKWYDVSDFADEIYEEKREITLTEKESAQIFVKETPHLAADWREKIAQPIENLPHAKHVEDVDDHLRPYIRYDGKPAFAALRMFSKTHLRVMIFEYLGQWRFYHHFDCKASFNVPRNAELDEIFGLKALEKLYFQTVKGIGYGDTSGVVDKALGGPDGIQVFGPMAISRRAYFKEDVVIFFQDGRVKTITHGVPERLKKKVREGGRVFANY